MRQWGIVRKVSGVEVIVDVETPEFEPITPQSPIISVVHLGQDEGVDTVPVLAELRRRFIGAHYSDWLACAKSEGCDMGDIPTNQPDSALGASAPYCKGSATQREILRFRLAFRKAFCVDDIEDLLMRAIALPRWVWIALTVLFVVVIFTAPRSGQ